MVTNNEAQNNAERLRATNEEKKNKLIKEKGAIFSDFSNENELPPEIMSQFLDNINAIENDFESMNQVQLYDFIGKPSYRKVEDVLDEEITEELKQLTELLDKNQICLETLSVVAEKEIYRFITEELFFIEIDDTRKPGLFSIFYYEHFHQNHELDIREQSYDFISSYLDKENDFYTYSLTSEAKEADWHIYFRKAFSSFQLNNFTITKLDFDTENALVQFTCDFAGVIEGSIDSLHFFGDGEFLLLYQWENWYIDSIKLPKNA